MIINWTTEFRSANSEDFLIKIKHKSIATQMCKWKGNLNVDIFLKFILIWHYWIC